MNEEKRILFELLNQPSMKEAKHKRLFMEMIVRGISKEDLAKLLGISKGAVKDRINGKISFTLTEACRIKHTYFPEYPLDELFFTDFYDKAAVNV